LKDERHIAEACAINHERRHAGESGDGDQDHHPTDDNVFARFVVFETVLNGTHIRSPSLLERCDGMVNSAAAQVLVVGCAVSLAL
jgi:hypothetical protein